METLARVFGTNETEPDPQALLQFLAGLGWNAEGHFHGDEQGWFRLDFGDDETMRVERYLGSEEGMRAELNTWAAWVEASGEDANRAELMRILISTKQVMVLHNFPPQWAGQVSSYLARQTDGICQADGAGFFDADGNLWLPE